MLSFLYYYSDVIYAKTAITTLICHINMLVSFSNARVLSNVLLVFSCSSYLLLIISQMVLLLVSGVGVGIVVGVGVGGTFSQ